MRSRLLVLALSIVACTAHLFRVSHAENPQPRHEPQQVAEADAAALDLVHEALYREVYSLQADRERLLAEAEKLAPALPSVQWNRGRVRFGGNWVDVDEVPALVRQQRELQEYEYLRTLEPDTVEAHLRLAEWCEAHELPAQRRAHLERVLDQQPEHETARRGLGHERVNGQWQDREQLATRAAAQESRFRSRHFRQAILKIRKQLRDDRPAVRSRGEEALTSITDIDAIPTLETWLAFDSQLAGLRVVEWLATHPKQAAVAALARQSIYSPWEEVRERAAEELRYHPPLRYVPQLLAETATPVSTRFAYVPTGFGRFEYRTWFERETFAEQQELQLSREYVRRRRAQGSGQQTLLRAVANSVRLGSQWQSQVATQNAQTIAMNERVGKALRAATGKQLPNDPQRWWQWWNDDQDVVQQGPKQARRVQRGDQVAVVDAVPQQTFGGSGITVTGGNAECFAAGTSVWTTRGSMPIEHIRIGDLVLAQDVESGELDFKPVVRATVRDPEPLLRIELAGESLTTTRGHLFWVPGKMWRKAEQLSTAAPLHCLQGVTEVLEIAAVEEAKTYNLDVADFHTFFVGKTRILSHDVTPARPVDALVPGMQP